MLYSAIVGIMVSVLALRVHYSTDVQPCSINATWDCGIVNHSRYAEIAGVPVAALGIAGYAAIAILALLRFSRLTAAVTFGGFLFALYLSHVEQHILQDMVSLLRHLAGHDRDHPAGCRVCDDPTKELEARLIAVG